MHLEDQPSGAFCKRAAGRCNRDKFQGLPPLQLRPLAISPAGKNEVPPNATAGHKGRKQPRGKLDGSSVCTCSHNFVDTSAVMLEVLLGGEVQVENKAGHVDDANAPDSLHDAHFFNETPFGESGFPPRPALPHPASRFGHIASRKGNSGMHCRA